MKLRAPEEDGLGVFKDANKGQWLFQSGSSPVSLAGRALAKPGFPDPQCRDRLPKSMIPRYLEFVAQLPKTASEKVQKVALKARGIKSSWDRLQGK